MPALFLCIFTFRYQAYNDILEMDLDKPVIKGEEMPVNDLTPWLEEPFRVHFSGSGMSRIETNHREPLSVVKIKMALAYQLQYDLSQSQMLGIKNIRCPDEMDYFSTMEVTPVGSCEVTTSVTKIPEYLINKAESIRLHESEDYFGAPISDREEEKLNNEIPKTFDQIWTPGNSCKENQHFEIIKMVNFDNCTNLAGFHSYHGVEYEEEASMLTFPSQSLLFRAIIFITNRSPMLKESRIDHSMTINSAGILESEEKVTIRSTGKIQLTQIKTHFQKIYLNFPTSYHFMFDPDPRDIYNGQEPQLFEQNSDHERMFSKLEIALSSFIKESADMSESSFIEMLISAMQSISWLSVQELEIVEMSFATIQDRTKQRLILNTFYYLVAGAGSNNGIKFLMKKTAENVALQDSHWPLIICNAIRSIKMPSQLLFGNIISMLKNNNVTSNEDLTAAVLLGLSDLVYKMCFLKPQRHFNAPAFQACNSSFSTSITQLEKLLKYGLVNSASSDAPKTNEAVMIWLSALGNMGTEESSMELIKVINGKIQTNTLMRGAAIQNLARSFKKQPERYRSVLWSVIRNVTEKSEIRISAISLLTSSSITATDFHQLAFQTKFEPSQQVISFICSILKSQQYRNGKQEYTGVVPNLCRKIDHGILSSRHESIVQFMNLFGASFEQSLLWINSEESAFPKVFRTIAIVKGRHYFLELFAGKLYLQGFDEFLSAFFSEDRGFGNEANSTVLETLRQEIKEKLSMANVEVKTSPDPTAFFDVSFLGLRKLFNFNQNKYQDINVDGKMDTKNNASGSNRPNLYSLDAYSREFFSLTATGFPFYFSNHNPLIFYSKQDSLANNNLINSNIAIRVEYQRQIFAKIFSPLTECIHSSGVTASVALSANFKTQLLLRHGHFHISLSPDNVSGKNTKKEIFHFYVKPYTSMQKGTTASMEQDTKLIIDRKFHVFNVSYLFLN